MKAAINPINATIPPPTINLTGTLRHLDKSSGAFAVLGAELILFLF
jgi:hypothetical protein